MLPGLYFSLPMEANHISAAWPPMTHTAKHTRVNDILLGPLERPALRWLAAHQPAWMTPDKLTLIGVAGALMILVGYWLTQRNVNWLWLATAGFLVNWYGDSLDGTLARYRHIERPRYGFFVDHTVDALNTVMIVLGLGLSPLLHFEVAAFALVGYMLMMVLVYIRTYIDGVFKISYGKLGPTEVRVMLVAANTAVFFGGNPTFTLPFGQFSGFDLFAATIGVILFVIYITTVLQEARMLAKSE